MNLINLSVINDDIGINFHPRDSFAIENNIIINLDIISYIVVTNYYHPESVKYVVEFHCGSDIFCNQGYETREEAEKIKEKFINFLLKN